ncbi:ABC transporter permease [Actinokineospora auranticolor]|uniref:Putative ABC transport system permease protein n=1 Tax=Actinokineospora auranticolor TaxID=155976 RepID=A0A2S6GV02_9PSEU|nr:ABC transporter permease [Actinokineospora auranticolor]PPK68961.1 putative ABC transport system permease protein [Actinokineospora auranticolor]
MNAVWRVARAAVRRRMLQTVVIGVVVWVSAATVVMALGLLASSAAPFDRAHDEQRGAHLAAVFDSSAVDRLAGTSGRAGVEAAAGPYALAGVEAADGGGFGVAGELTAVGRADPAGAVDRVTVWSGRWVGGPGEIVLNLPPGAPVAPGRVVDLAGGGSVTVVGLAFSVSQTADAWVTPEQATAWGSTASQMLYRLVDHATAADISRGEASVSTGLPLLGTQSYLAVKQRFSQEAGVYVPFLTVFGALGLAVAVLSVANLVSGAVVAGYRHIGVLKALGYTPNQVMAVYLVMVTAPAVVGTALGVCTGDLVGGPLVRDAVEGFGVADTGVPWWVDLAVLVGMPALVAVVALLPALRARRQPAAAAISAGSRPGARRAPRVQRALSGTRLPRSVSLGLGVPFARPARSALTAAAVVLGVATVTLAVGVTLSVTAFRDAANPTRANQVDVMAAVPGGTPADGPDDPLSELAPRLGDAQDEAVLRAAPGVLGVVASSQQLVRLVGGNETHVVRFYRGDASAVRPRVWAGAWPARGGEVAVSAKFLTQTGLALGDTTTLEQRGKRVPVRIVGVVLENVTGSVLGTWETLESLLPGSRATAYQVTLDPDADRDAFARAVAAGDPGIRVTPPRGGTSSQAVVIISTATLLTLLLGGIAALGVFNTVVLNTRERRRDLGVLKSVGMTPRQVTSMVVTSMAGLGLVGGLIGLPLGMVVHRVVVHAAAPINSPDLLLSVVPDLLLSVYDAPTLVLLPLAGVGIAVLGALVPARRAARMTIAAALRSE